MLRCTERDRKLIAKCALCRWLTTTQIRRMYFPEASVNAVQKRLRKLAEAGYLQTHRENIQSETLHAVGPKGKAIVEEKGLDYAGTTEVPRQIEHLSGINDVRIAVESGTIPVAYFFAFWQFASRGWMHPVIPDAVFALQTPTKRTYVVEFDRATEGFAVIADKIRQYMEGLPGFPFEAILLITERPRRLDRFKHEVQATHARFYFLAGTLGELQTNSVDACSFLDVVSGANCKLLDIPLREGGTN